MSKYIFTVLYSSFSHDTHEVPVAHTFVLSMLATKKEVEQVLMRNENKIPIRYNTAKDLEVLETPHYLIMVSDENGYIIAMPD